LLEFLGAQIFTNRKLNELWVVAKLDGIGIESRVAFPSLDIPVQLSITGTQQPAYDVPVQACAVMATFVSATKTLSESVNCVSVAGVFLKRKDPSWLGVINVGINNAIAA